MHPCHSFAHWSPSAIFLSLDSIGYINNIYSNVFLNLSIFLELPLFSFPIAHLLSPPSPLRHLYLHIRRRPREFLRLTNKTKVCICFSPPLPSSSRFTLSVRMKCRQQYRECWTSNGDTPEAFLFPFICSFLCFSNWIGGNRSRRQTR